VLRSKSTIKCQRSQYELKHFSSHWWSKWPAPHPFYCIALHFYCMSTIDSFMSILILISAPLDSSCWKMSRTLSWTILLLKSTTHPVTPLWSTTEKPFPAVSLRFVLILPLRLITHSSKTTGWNWLWVCWVEVVSKITLVSSKKRWGYFQAPVLGSATHSSSVWAVWRLCVLGEDVKKLRMLGNEISPCCSQPWNRLFL